VIVIFIAPLQVCGGSDHAAPACYLLIASPWWLLQVLYFGDVCAGPGGFTEYMLTARKWRAKGFGFTLRGSGAVMASV